MKSIQIFYTCKLIGSKCVRFCECLPRKADSDRC